MFITKAEKEELHNKIKVLEERLDGAFETMHAVLSDNSFVRKTIDNMIAPTPYGRCKDGTPRKKPGVKKGARK